MISWCSAACEVCDVPLDERENVDEDVNPEVLGLIAGDAENRGAGISTAKWEKER